MDWDDRLIPAFPIHAGVLHFLCCHQTIHNNQQKWQGKKKEVRFSVQIMDDIVVRIHHVESHYG